MFAKVIIDISNANVDRLFTYSIPDELEIDPGHRVLVPFGRGNKQIEGFVIETFEETTTNISFEIKPILRRMEPYTVLLPDQLKLSEWITRAYHCTRADALRVMIPAKLRGSRIKEKIVRTFLLAEDIDIQAARNSLLKKDGSPRSPKQLEIFDLIANSGLEISSEDINSYIPNASAAINALVGKGMLIESGHVTFRNPFANERIISTDPPLLTDEQKAALNIINSEEPGRCILLHGVTGSGKTEVYMQAIASVLESGGGAILLVPEISLTPQTTDRFRSRFGELIAVLHSHLSDGERYDEWRRIRFGKAKVVIGARSAVFAPVENLQLIVIDEEHEPSYQSETTPKYSAIEVALRRIKLTNARLVLGSATPSLGDYYKAKRGLFTLAEMPDRINGIPLPKVDIVDMRDEFLNGNDSIFSNFLTENLHRCLDNGEQAILFLNRRGYSSHAECRACGFVFTCPNCDVALTYHKYDETLRCHYCGAHFSMPKLCPGCGKEYLKYTGIGTQQVEEQLIKLFPEIRCIRMDTDTTGGKTSHRELLSAFGSGKADVLIGTQMVAKGLDIPNVTLVGVIFADSTLFHSDYRSSERTFQLLTQVAGRAGRAEKNGNVIIQTNAPEHRAIRLCKNHDYKSFYALEIRDRMHTLFPPFAVFIRAMFIGYDEAHAYESSERFAKGITLRLLSTYKLYNSEKELLFVAPGAAPIKRRSNEFRYSVIIKLVRTSHTAAAINAIYAFGDEFNDEYYRGVEINPADML